MSIILVVVAALSLARADGMNDRSADRDVNDVIVAVVVDAEVPNYVHTEHALNTAKRAARIKAVESGAAQLADKNVLLHNDITLFEQLATSARGIVVDERWSEPVVVGGKRRPTITLNANVNVSAAERALCSVVKEQHDPKVTLAAVERAGE